MNHRKKNIPAGSRTCAWEDCTERNDTNSKYCYYHKVIAAKKFREMINNENNKRARRYEAYARVNKEAKEKAMKAAKEHKPTPMVVERHVDMFDDTSPVFESYEPVESGVCGFASIVVRPGNCSLAIWLKKHEGFGKSYYGGVEKGVSMFGQSYERKCKYAEVYANTMMDGLKGIIDEGTYVYVRSRLD